VYIKLNFTTHNPLFLCFLYSIRFIKSATWELSHSIAAFYRVLISPYPDQEGNKLQRPNSNFCKPLKRKFRNLSVQQVSAAAMTSASDEKWRPFNFFFSRVGLRTCQHPCKYTLNWILLLIIRYFFVSYFQPCSSKQQPEISRILYFAYRLPYFARHFLLTTLPICRYSRLSRNLNSFIKVT